MPRRTIDLPASLPFETNLTVRITDINYGGHLGNDAVLGLVHEVRCRFFRDLGFTETDVDGCGILMIDAEIIYLSEAFAGETIRVRAGAAEPGRTGCSLYYQLNEAGSGREVARVRTGITFFDYSAGKPRRMPAAFREACFP